MSIFRSNGKLLITAEYLVLDGAEALALPTKLGQTLLAEKISEPIINWISLDHKGYPWFEESIRIDNDQIILKNDIKANDISQRLLQILNATLELNPNFIDKRSGYKITTKLDFPRNWGLGTSSTLINNIAQWAQVNPYKLLERTFGGSGYDIACAQSSSALIYKLEHNNPIVKKIDFKPKFKEHLYFVHLNKKQDSREGIAYYKANRKSYITAIKEVNDITESIINCESLTEFDELITQHEIIISMVTNQKPVKALLFSDFNGGIKSLGAWGGDFILVSSEKDPKTYFEKKGFNTILSYSDLIL